MQPVTYICLMFPSHVPISCQHFVMSPPVPSDLEHYYAKLESGPIKRFAVAALAMLPVDVGLVAVRQFEVCTEKT